MRAESAIRIRVSTKLKTEWQARARADGISLSHALRTATRLGMILGPARLHESVTTISAIRRDLHAAIAELTSIAATGSGAEADKARAAVARAYEAADATATFLRMR